MRSAQRGVRERQCDESAVREVRNEMSVQRVRQKERRGRRCAQQQKREATCGREARGVQVAKERKCKRGKREPERETELRQRECNEK